MKVCIEVRLELTDKIQFVKGIGPTRSKKFAEHNIFTVEDLLRLFPRKHLDLSSVYSICEIKENDVVTVAGTISRIQSRKTRKIGERVDAFVHDGTGGIQLTWFKSSWMKSKLLQAGTGFFSGKVTRFQGRNQMVNPLCELQGDGGTTAGGILPVYPPYTDISQTQLRKIIRQTLDLCSSNLIDPLQSHLKDLGIIPYQKAIEQIHFPESEVEYEESFNRFVLEEFILFQLAILTLKKERKIETDSSSLKINSKIDQHIRKRFPFQLTNAQNKVISEIVLDITANKKMNRLLQGDVGSGKTAVAIYFLLSLVANKKQGAIVAPTEVLATQHYLSFKETLKGSKVTISFLIGSQTKKERKVQLDLIESGQAQIIVGTHAIFSDDVNYHDLGGVVIDEQHRFGVLQREKLIKKGNNPHVLVMTATPIPRTLTLTIYGDLDTSIIDELPPGRHPIKTIIVKETQRKRAYATIKQEIEKGHQAFVVCPLIEENEDFDYSSATELYKDLKENVFPEFNIGLLHGKVAINEKKEVMDDFKSGKINILVATQVIEVGVDCPNASVILIDGADRFGLAQLHQLRGRVGRGEHLSKCLLMTKKGGGPSLARLKVLEDTNDGFKISEADLEFRGTGEYFGTRQSGISTFKLGNPLRDIKEMIRARKFASYLLNKNYDKEENNLLKIMVEREYRNRMQLGEIS
ncbi:MAG: ATP-dependent DNA helicase RecG [Planctomycetota bacterium]|nr:MAG: ATP-dependent DNA helicase RecG [Planctomycetota bacterium]